ncbi:uncharacterized protein DUF1524 [Prosthecobacter fusiformis]|uniref:Uncharacterized protein DUF1524 n=1 Tax=Prosthecobacter fusiformis TaxID=48464 RepID=A0A4V3FEJ6_9BACT|nr:DUF262 domain-containing protein [Prosthecobacter fusiformis]TDU67263.1 uncharacterized protein DUF1524 [Prosthecobacter fusiformis]
MAKIENHKYTIEEAFRECFYIIPDYQREYVWTDKEVQQLLADIDEQIGGDNTREYFIGTVLVSPVGGQRQHFEVIDGQQRLTTFFLLLCALKHCFEGEVQSQAIGGLITTSYISADGENQVRLKLEPRYENAGEVMTRIVDIASDPEKTRAGIQAAGIKSFGSLERLLSAYGTIYRYLQSNYQDPKTLKRYFGYLANNVIFFQISTDVSSALKIFETINERGVGLNPMDLLKNLLFTQVLKDDFTKLKGEWEKVTKPLAKVGEKPLRFLRYFLMASYRIENARRDGVVREDEIYDWFVKKENEVLCNYKAAPFAFVRKIIISVECYVNFTQQRDNNGNANVAMNNLAQLTGGAFSLHYVLLLAVSPLPPALFDHFVKQLESFLFYFIFTKSPTKELERSFSIWADELRFVCEIADQALQREQLNIFLMNRFQAGMKAKEPELSDGIKRYNFESMQQYRTRYLLRKLAQHVDMAFRGIKVAGSLDEYRGLEIEHILPNTPTADLLADFKRKNPGRDYNQEKLRLGNLTLLEKPLNIIAGNNFFELKKPKYTACGSYLTRSLVKLEECGNNTSITRINTKLVAFDEWTAETIDLRQAILIALVKEIWSISPIDVQ